MAHSIVVEVTLKLPIDGALEDYRRAVQTAIDIAGQNSDLLVLRALIGLRNACGPPDGRIAYQ